MQFREVVVAGGNELVEAREPSERPDSGLDFLVVVGESSTKGGAPDAEERREPQFRE